MALAQFQAFFSQTEISLGISATSTHFCNGQEVSFESELFNLLEEETPVGQIVMTVDAAFNQAIELTCGQNYSLQVEGIYSNWNDVNYCPYGNCHEGGCYRYRDVEYFFTTDGTSQPTTNRISFPYNSVIPIETAVNTSHVYNYLFQGSGDDFRVTFSDVFNGVDAYSDNCGSLTYTLTAALTTFTYTWDFGDRTTFTTSDPNPPPHIYNLDDPNVAQTYTITCTATPDNLSQNNFASCTFTSSIDITVNPSPTVSITGDNVICENEVITLTATTESGNTLLWQDGTTDSQFITGESGTYTVIASNGVCEATDIHVILPSTFTVDKQQTVKGYLTGSSYVFQTVDYSITITNNSPVVETYSVFDNVPDNFIFQSITSPLGYVGSNLGATLTMQPNEVITLTYTGYYNVYSDEKTRCLPQIPNTVTVTNIACNESKEDQTEMCIVFGCPGHIEGENHLDASLINQEQLFTVSYRQHKTFSNVSKIAFRVYYPDFLTLLPEEDPVQNGDFASPLVNPAMDFQNYEMPITNRPFKTTDVYVEFDERDLGYGTGIIRVFDLKFKTNIPDLNQLEHNVYNVGVISILPSVNSTINTVNQVTIEQKTGDNIQQTLSLLTQVGVVEIINHPLANTMKSSDFNVVINPCDNKVFVKAVTETGSHRWQFNDPLQPFVPIWGGEEFFHQYLEPGTYSIKHLYIDEFGNGSSTTKEITISPVAFDYPSGIAITSASQTITDGDNDGFIRVRGPVSIAEGLTYQIKNKTIEFADDLIPDPTDAPRTHSGIIVNRNATLNLTNSTLRSVSVCPTSMWQGIQVYGDEPVLIIADSKNTKSLGQISKPLQNGKLNTTNCVIEEARIGIAAYKVFVPFGQQQNEFGRGVVNTNTTTFRNNHISIGFKGRNFVENTSIIKACIFTNTADLKDVVLFPSQGIKTYVQLDQVKNVQILANSFYGRTSYAPESRGNGIVSYDAAYTVTSAVTSAQQGASPTPNSFANLSKGIDVYSKGGANKVVRVKNNSFNQVMQGITANGSNFDEISFNTFNVPLGSETQDSWAINLFNSSGFLTTENIFNSTQSNDHTYGLLVRNAALASGQAYKNTFSGKFFAATQAEQENAKLQIKCNTYSGVNTYDWTVTSGTLANQGECTSDASSPAGNVFGTCNTGDESQIWKNPIVPEFAYRSHDDRTPICTSNDIFIENCGTISNVSSCPTIVSNPCPNCSALAKNEYDNTPPGLEKERLKAEVIRLLAQEGDVQALVTFLTQENTPEDVKILIPTHIENGECAQARALLNTIDIGQEENKQFVKLYDVLTSLCEASEDEAGDGVVVSEEQEARINEVSTTETQVSVHAASFLAQLHKTTIKRTPERIIVPQGMMFQNSNNENKFEGLMEEKTSFLHVYPNPSEEQIVVSNTNKTNSEIIISDALGRIHFNGNLNEANLYQLTLSLTKGMYVVKQITEDGKVNTKSILIKD